MITAIIGHRGCGKTSFLTRLEEYHRDLNLQGRSKFLDLDAEIVTRENQTIDELISDEANFRAIEENTFREVSREFLRSPHDVYVAIGAGFTFEFPSDVEVWWVRRETDKLGRIFLDRPRLDINLNPLDEYQARFESREARYSHLAHRQITLREGWQKPNEFEKALVGLKPSDLGISLTLTPWILENERRRDLFFHRFLQQGVRYFEFRDDLLSEGQIRENAARVPAKTVLISFRKLETSPSLLEFSGPYATDWALELGPSPLGHNAIVSLHERQDGETVDEAAQRLLSHKADHHKLAVPIADHTELWVGHRFYRENPKARSFLPMAKQESEAGKWAWYRLAQKPPLNFAREGVGLKDQPLVFDFLCYPKNAGEFAAILGSPVELSRTPAEQDEFFRSRSMGVVAMPIIESEMNSLNLGILERLGLRAAAVTSPLKAAAKEACDHIDKKAVEVGAVNTIVKARSGWSGTNTDLTGLARTFHVLNLKGETAVWGGGGMRLVLRALLPEARFFSARRGEEIWANWPADSELAHLPEIETLIWAVPRSRMPACQWPREDWLPKYVFDLNYTDDSPGREYALRVGARYFSGLNFFLAQADAQREFWARELVNETLPIDESVS